MRSLAGDLKFPDGYREELANTYKMQALDCVARELMGLGFAADAVPLLIEAVSLAEAIDPNSVPPAVATLEVIQSPAQIRQHLNAAIQGLDTALLAPLAGRLIAETIEVINTNKDATPSKQSRPRDQALDMVLMVYPRELESATVRSLLAESIAACDARQLAALDLPLESLRKAHPDDLSVAIARALRALAGDDAKRAESDLGRLLQLLDQIPLESLPGGTRPNARQPAMAARSIPLWVVAAPAGSSRARQRRRSEIGSPPGRSMRPAARAITAGCWPCCVNKASARSTAAIKRRPRPPGAGCSRWSSRRSRRSVSPPGPPIGPRPLPSPRPFQRGRRLPAPTSTSTSHNGMAKGRANLACSLIAILCCSYEGKVSLASYQAQQPSSPRTTRPGQPRTKAAGPRAGRAASPRSNLPLLTLDRFEQAMQIARLAAEHDLPDLSVRAVREALRAGPPIIPAAPTLTPTPRAVARARAMATDEGPADQVSPRVVANVIELERLWRKHKLSADVAYQVLRDVVLPAARPDEVFLYASPLNVATLRRPQSVGMLLADWAVKAGKADELIKTMTARNGPAMSALPLAMLSAQLALAMNDPAAIREALKAIAARLKTDTSHHTSELACHVAIPGLFRPEAELAAVAIGVVDSAAKGMETANQPEPLASLLLILAQAVRTG